MGLEGLVDKTIIAMPVLESAHESCVSLGNSIDSSCSNECFDEGDHCCFFEAIFELFCVPVACLALCEPECNDNVRPDPVVNDIVDDNEHDNVDIAMLQIPTDCLEIDPSGLGITGSWAMDMPTMNNNRIPILENDVEGNNNVIITNHYIRYKSQNVPINEFSNINCSIRISQDENPQFYISLDAILPLGRRLYYEDNNDDNTIFSDYKQVKMVVQGALGQTQELYGVIEVSNIDVNDSKRMMITLSKINDDMGLATERSLSPRLGNTPDHSPSTSSRRANTAHTHETSEHMVLRRVGHTDNDTGDVGTNDSNTTNRFTLNTNFAHRLFVPTTSAQNSAKYSQQSQFSDLSSADDVDVEVIFLPSNSGKDTSKGDVKDNQDSDGSSIQKGGTKIAYVEDSDRPIFGLDTVTGDLIMNECPLCFLDYTVINGNRAAMVTKCGHVWCEDCILQVCQVKAPKGEGECIICRQSVLLSEIKPLIRPR